LELSALTDHAEYLNETLWLIGNRTLLSLNLSSKFIIYVKSNSRFNILCSFFFKGNELTDLSLNYFLLALQYQKTYLDIHKLQPNQGTGILRLIFSVRLLHLIYLK